MTIEEIKNGETSHLEFKREIPEKKENLLKTVSAFSNTSGGKIIFGIDDKTLEVVGIEGDVFKLMDSVINSISDNIEPLISPNINVATIENKTVIVLEIFPTNHTPCFLKSKGKDNGTFIRIGATSRIADFYSLRELELNGIRSSFDSQKCVNLMNDKTHFNSEITQKLCSEIQKRMEKAGVHNVNVNEKTLEGLGVLKNINGELVPTNAYALLTLSDFYDFSRCSIRCACFKGYNKAIFLDKLDCTGAIFEQVEQALNFVLKNLKVGIKFVGVQGIDDFEIPVNALREAIVNAVVHRNYMIEEPTQIAIYDDKVEIVSPGRLVSGLSLESALNGKSVARNPILAKVFRLMKLMEEWGSGFRRIYQECESAKIKLPKFQENELDCSIVFERNYEGVESEENSTLVEKFGVNGKSSVQKFGVNEKSSVQIMKLMKEKNSITAEEISEILKISKRAVEKQIQKLRGNGKIERLGSDKNGSWQVVTGDEK